MTVELFPPLTSSTIPQHIPKPKPLTHGPRFIRTQAMSRWHRVRSGMFHPAWHPFRPEYTSYQLWCGQLAYSGRVVARDADPDDGLPVCASCEGRAIGSGQEDNDGPRDLTFVPRWLTPPRWCPGSNRSLYEPIPDPRGFPRLGICLACGAAEPIRASGGPYRTNVGLKRHEAADLIRPCSWHGWQYVGLIEDGDVGCTGCGEPLGGAA